MKFSSENINNDLVLLPSRLSKPHARLVNKRNGVSCFSLLSVASVEPFSMFASRAIAIASNIFAIYQVIL